jgi:hypothetical protein
VEKIENIAYYSGFSTAYYSAAFSARSFASPLHNHFCLTALPSTFYSVVYIL